MQLATSAIDPMPNSSSALQTTRSALNATPAMPMPLLALAAMVPATWVPWSLSSAHWSLTTSSCDLAHATVWPA
jgi:hypothetical protein